MWYTIITDKIDEDDSIFTVITIVYLLIFLFLILL